MLTKKVFALVLAIILLVPNLAFAQRALLPSCAYGGDCGFCDLVYVVEVGFEWLLYFLGIVMFVFFAFGAVYLVYGKGRADKVQTGKEMIKGALYGGLAVLIAWQLINLVLYILTTPTKDEFDPQSGEDINEPAGYKIFGNPWNYLCAPGQDVKSGNYNQQICFSRGDGSPCKGEILDDKGTTTNKSYNGLCLGGTCVCNSSEGDVCKDVEKSVYNDACNYLEVTYTAYFEDYTCREPKSLLNCINDSTLCPNNPNTLCCGVKTEAKFQ